MLAIDTNVLVRLIVGDDLRQANAAEAYIRKGAWVSHIVLAEALWVTASYYQRSPVEIAQTIERLLFSTELTLQDADVVEAALSLFRKYASMGFSDCLVLATARKAGHLPLGTFDRALDKIDGAERVA